MLKQHETNKTGNRDMNRTSKNFFFGGVRQIEESFIEEIPSEQDLARQENACQIIKKQYVQDLVWMVTLRYIQGI
jgi:hypothetical protein